MMFVNFELTVPEDRTAITSQYYAAMQALVKKQSGFISEVPFMSPVYKGQQLLLVRFVDEDSVRSWRLQMDHLRIQKKARETIFDAYRLRVGPELLEKDCNNEEDEITTGHPGPYMVVYQYPKNGGIEPPATGKLSDIIDPKKISVENVLKGLVDNAIYHGAENVLWLTAWSSKTAATKFKDSIRGVNGQVVHVIKVARDYGKFDRKEAPKGADEAQDACIAACGKSDTGA